MARDRIELAWELRDAIHKHVLANARCTLESICAAVPGSNHNTVRRATQKMRSDGDLALVSKKANIGRYVALTASIRPAKEMRDRMASGGRGTQKIALEAFKRKARERKAASRSKPSGRYVEGERNRQELLDLLNTNPWSSSAECARRIAANRGREAMVKGDHCTTLQRLSRMERFGEVEKRRKAECGKGQTWEWRALVISTLSAEECAARVYANSPPDSSANERDQSVTVVDGSKTIHRGTDRDRPLQNSRGQGAVRERNTINCHQLY